MRLVTPLLALAIAAGTLVLPAQAVAADAPLVTATFAPALSGVVSPGSNLTVNGIVSNPTDATVPAGTATVYLQRSPVADRAALSTWLDSDDPVSTDALGTALFSVATPDIPAGRTLPVSITVPAAAIDLGTQSGVWGARELAVVIAAGETQVQARSTVLWSAGTAPSLGLALAVPLTVPHSAAGLISAELLAQYTETGGVLTRQLDQVIDTNVAIGIDPMILVSIQSLGTSTPPSAVSWLARLKAATNDTFALAWSDSDLAGASQAGARGVLVPTSLAINPSLFPGQSPAPTASAGATPTPTPTPTPGAPAPLPTLESLLQWSYTMTNVAWPADNTVVEADLDAFETDGFTSTILSSSNLSYGGLGYTPSAGAMIGKHLSYVSDAGISGLLRTASEAPNELAWEAVMAKLTGSLAVIGRESAPAARTILATLDRTSVGNQFRFDQTTAAINALGWVTPARLGTGVASSTDRAAATLAPQPEPASRVLMIRSLLASEERVASFSSVLVDPTLLTSERRLSLLAILGNTWVPTSTAWTTAADKYLSQSTKSMNSVKIASTGSQFLTSNQSKLRVTVANTLDYPVTVYVSARSPNGILNVTEDRVELTVEAKSQALASVPVKSVANGKTRVAVSLSSATSVAIGSPASLSVDVQAGWEGALTAILAVLVIGVFGFGIYRNIAKRRKGKWRTDDTVPDDTVPDDPEAAEPTA